MENKTKQNIITVVIGVILFVALSNLGALLNYIGRMIDIIIPIIVGGIIAFVLSVPVEAYSKIINKLCNKFNRSISSKTNNILSIILTIVSLLLILSIVMVIVIPEIANSIKLIIEQLEVKWPEWKLLLESYNINTEYLSEYLDFNKLKVHLPKLGEVLGNIVGTASSTVGVVANVIFSAITAFYILLFKQELYRQFKKLMYANIKQDRVDKIIETLRLLKDTYKKFLVGQCKESAILGILMLIALSIFRLPYAGLIAILTFVCAFIPYIGAFISCGVGVFLTLLYSPQQAIICLIVYQVVQFIEGQFIYPKVVGSSVGMLPIWTFMSVLIGGKLFGIAGILFMIPLVATIHIIVSRNTNKKLRNKNINIT